jgi:hypothetical protein
MEKTKTETVLDVAIFLMGLVIVLSVCWDMSGCSYEKGVIDHASGKVQAIQNPDGTWWVGKSKEAADGQ